jgi:hypothetical protein
MIRKILVDNDGATFVVGALDLSKVASELMCVDILPLEPYAATLFKKAISLVRTVNVLKWAIGFQVSLHVSSLDIITASILASNDRFWTIEGDMVVHLI